MSGGDKRPPPTGYSTTSDSRLDPEAGMRRNSVGSMADERDYSRRILKVSCEATHDFTFEDIARGVLTRDI